MSSKHKESTNPCPRFVWEFSAALCIFSLLLDKAYPNQLCRKPVLPTERVREWDMAEKCSHFSHTVPITRSSWSSKRSKNAHPWVCSVPLGAWLGKLRLLEQTPWRYLACSGSLLDQQTGSQPPTYCKTNIHKTLHHKLLLLVFDQWHVMFKRELRSYNCKILLGSSKSINQKVD